MLKLYKADGAYFSGFGITDYVCALPGATNVKTSQSINESSTLDFYLPYNEQGYEEIQSGYVIDCEGQGFCVTHYSTDGKGINVSCEHVFYRDAKKLHIPNLGSLESDGSENIGESVYNIMTKAISSEETTGAPNATRDGHFELIGENELPEGLTWVGSDGSKIDLESIDKTDLFSVITAVIAAAGRGELYVRNCRFAIVERLGADKSITISASKQAESISVAVDFSETVTRLFPYGKDDLTIVNATQNTNGTPYIESGKLWDYPYISEGYMDFTDIDDPDKLYERARWEFDPLNINRIDVPAVTISGSVADMSRIDTSEERAELGDGVYILHEGKRYYERVKTITRYPYEAKPDDLTIGRVKTTLFDYLNQLGAIARRYRNISSTGGIQSMRLTGGAIRLNSRMLTASKNGDLYWNGKKIILEG